MDWQDIVMLVITALLLFVWVPVLIISVRRALRKKDGKGQTFIHF